MTSGAWKVERDDEQVVWATLDKPATSTNVLSRDVLQELGVLLEPLEQSPPRALVIRSGKPGGFIAGADIKEFTGLQNAEQGFELTRAGQLVLDRLAALPCVSVAAIHGFALGGGLELALACRYRVAVDDERLALGLPEVQLGIHPGFGGTVRTVRLVGVRPAMDLMLTGRSVRADQALKVGLVDKLVPNAQELSSVARDFIRTSPPPHRPPFTERILSWAVVRPFIRPALLRQVARNARRDHYPAPY